MRRKLPLLLAAAWLSSAGSACQQSATNAQLRALQSSGPTAFLCLSSPTLELAEQARPLEECTRARTDTVNDYSIPHLYALVTQPITGEVAVIDLTTEENALIDQDPAIPGASFLPVGANPTDLATTPGGFAAFVSSAEANFEAIYALPSTMVRGASPRLTSWPSCRLPAAPDSMLLLLDPADADGQVRPSCDAGYGDVDPNASCEGVEHCHGDLSLDAVASGSPGRYKLAVTLPSEGGIAIIDAQALLDQEAGQAAPCQIERWLPLQVELPAPLPPSTPNTSTACVDEPYSEEPFSPGFAPLPGGMTLTEGELFIADRRAPLIHRVQVSSPCEPVEGPPLLATSDEDPSRVVTTRRVAVSPLTLDLKRFLYAIDEVDGSIMIYDVSDDASSNRPLKRASPATNPFQPPDRVRFQSPPRDIVIVRHDNDTIDGTTGTSLPLRCDPAPEATGSPAAAYRTDSNYDSGAGPSVLRGVFAFAVLASGDVVAIDIDDYDAACRGPQTTSASLGCSEPFVTDQLSSGEYSCNIVAPHQIRAGAYLGYVDGVINSRPSLSAFPLLFDDEGSLLKLSEANPNIPRMRAPNDAADVVIGPDLVTLSGGVAIDQPNEHIAAPQLTDPRAHILEQTWTVTYEGALPGFNNRFAQLSDLGDGTLRMREVSSRFCSRGVLGKAAFEGILLDEGVSPQDAPTQATQLADYVQIVAETAIENDSYWTQQNSCSYNSCQTAFGSTSSPTSGRDFSIMEATEDTLELIPRGVQSDEAAVKCCFPGVVPFRIHTGNQWAVVGNSIGFLHHVIADDNGACRLSCDDQDRLLNGRVRAIGATEDASSSNPRLFRNPFFSFAINDGISSRGMSFQFVTQRPFRALSLSVATSTSNNDVQPVAIRYLTPTGELVVSDGSLEGITLLDLDELTVVRQYN